MDDRQRADVREGFRLQARMCAEAGAASCGAILAGAAEDIATAGGGLDPILHDWTQPVGESAVALRVLGAVHRLALEGRAPDLAALLPTCGGRADPSRVWPAARVAIAAESAFIRSYLARPPQTNEVARSASLLGGFLTIAASVPLPMRLIELAASAGLNQCWDQYRVVTDRFTWGPPDSALTLRCDWQGPAPPMPKAVPIASRIGCDRDPIDLNSPDDCRRLESYIWADQPHRLERLRTAAGLARGLGVHIERGDAEVWLPEQIATPVPGVVTVVFHSIFWNYLPEATRARLRDIVTAAGARATAAAPFAWLSMETLDLMSMPDLNLTIWPGGETRHLATVHYHGDWVRWRG